MKKFLTKKNVILTIIIFVILLLIIIFAIYNPFLYFKVKDNKSTIKISVNEELKLPEVKAYIFNKNISEKIKKSGKVNTKKIGKYKIKYKVKFLLTTKIYTLTVNVVDEELPNITLKGTEEVIICPNKEYEEEGYIALDNYDGDITDKVEVKKYDDYIEYSVIDSSNNKKSIKRNIKKEDKEIPNITLNGNINNKIVINSNFNDLGYSATDNCDGDISSNVYVINNLDNTKVGVYEIIYKVNDSSGNENSITRTVEVVNNDRSNDYSNIVEGPTYINGILIVNKKYSLPVNYGGTNQTATNALYSLQSAASLAGYSMPLLSGYRSYYTQKNLYNSYVQRDGHALADTYSARPGHSEHQTGLAFDVGSIDDNYGNTPAGIWLSNNAHLYGFIIRYPKGKENITGYQYEPWHIRYVGIQHSTNIYNQGVTLEEYLGL